MNIKAVSAKIKPYLPYTQKDKEQNPNTTNAGFKTAVVYGTIESALNVGLDILFTKYQRQFSLKDEFLKVSNIKKYNHQLLKSLPLLWLTTFTCGAIVNKKINDRQEKASQEIKTKNPKELLLEDENYTTTRIGNIYYKSEIGRKVGASLGTAIAVLSIISTLVKSKGKVNMPLWEYAFNTVDNIGCSALGGYFLGYMSDRQVNKTAKINADK